MDDDVAVSVAVRQPRDCGGAVLIVPGGLQPGLELLDTDQADTLTDAGLTVVAFDPRGRGESEGEEDANGPIDQDDLAALLRWVAARERVDPDAVVLSSRSFGAAMAAGALSRHDDLRPLAWVDYEGPGWLEDDLTYAEGIGPDALREFAEVAEDTAAWWDAREPAGLIGGVTTSYWRLQGLPDHALGGRIAHTLACVNGATAASEVTYNGQPLPLLPTTAEQLTEDAVAGGLEPEDALVTGVLLGLFDGAE
ncbi:MAG: pimeloyl-ACP methyl ester carboxylesterase [Myxococcota bacterium]|jgi:pimeloyl-ACP methyl ester carboxylesterase